MKFTYITFTLPYTGEECAEKVTIKWSDKDPMREFYVAKYKRMPEYDKEYGYAFWMDGYRLGKSLGYGFVGTGEENHYEFTFNNAKDADQARKLLESIKEPA